MKTINFLHVNKVCDNPKMVMHDFSVVSLKSFPFSEKGIIEAQKLFADKMRAFGATDKRIVELLKDEKYEYNEGGIYLIVGT